MLCWDRVAGQQPLGLSADKFNQAESSLFLELDIGLKS